MFCNKAAILNLKQVRNHLLRDLGPEIFSDFDWFLPMINWRTDACKMSLTRANFFWCLMIFDVIFDQSLNRHMAT